MIREYDTECERQGERERDCLDTCNIVVDVIFSAILTRSLRKIVYRYNFFLSLSVCVVVCSLLLTYVYRSRSIHDSSCLYIGILKNFVLEKCVSLALHFLSLSLSSFSLLLRC